MKIVIADDHAVVRSGFSMIINMQSDMEVVATAADGVEAYQKVSELEPDILLLDLSMPPGENGLVSVGRIHDDFPGTKVLVLTMHDDEEYLFHVLKNGASGYILKNAPDEELILAIRTVYNNGVYIEPQMASSVVREFIKNDGTTDRSDSLKLLSKRELEILPLVAKGFGNKEIAEMLFVSVKTVEAHKAKLMEKLGLQSKPELVEFALKKKLLEF